MNYIGYCQSHQFPTVYILHLVNITIVTQAFNIYFTLHSKVFIPLLLIILTHSCFLFSSVTAAPFTTTLGSFESASLQLSMRYCALRYIHHTLRSSPVNVASPLPSIFIVFDLSIAGFYLRASLACISSSILPSECATKRPNRCPSDRAISLFSSGDCVSLSLHPSCLSPLPIMLL